MAIIEEFLSSILRFLRAKDAMNLQLWLRVEPPLPDQYYQLGRELKQRFTADGKALEQLVERLLPENSNTNEADVWPGFLAFITEYLEFWRDVNFKDLLETHTQLNVLVKLANSINSPGDMLIKLYKAPVSLQCQMHHTVS